MRYEIEDALKLTAVICVAVLMIVQVSCTRSEVSSKPATEIDEGWGAEQEGQQRDIIDEEQQKEVLTYDLEDEEPEDDLLDEADKLENRIEVTSPDTFKVEDISTIAERETDYTLGYRIQVFATAELYKAEEIKRQAEAVTGYDSYIEFENGLYKVRVGDFGSREEAGKARAELVEYYTDCWIVETTIKR